MVTSGVLVYVKVGKNLEVDEPLRQTRTCAFSVRLRRGLKQQPRACERRWSGLWPSNDWRVGLGKQTSR